MGDAVRWLNPAMCDPRERALVDAVIDRTCTDTSAGFYWNVIGVQLLWLDTPGVSYAAANKLTRDRRLTCDYDAIACSDADERAAWARLIDKNTNYYVSLEASADATPEGPVYTTFNCLNEPILKRIETSGQFRLEPGIGQTPGLLIFKRVDRIDHVVQGRSFSDRGQHARAIEELKQATAVQPENVEAWANLAFAYERAGDLLNAIAAGVEARRLSPTHYYVHLGLARAFAGVQRWPESVTAAEEAARNTPGAAHRADAMLARRSAFAAGDSRKGCTLLKGSEELQPNPERRRALAAHGCER